MLDETQMLWEEGVYQSQLDPAGTMPISLFLPQAYEPRYPYPLLVFLHGHGEGERQWIDAVPSLSRRNYIGIGLRGMRQVRRNDGSVGFSWGRNRRCDSIIEDYVLTAVRETMQVCHVHSERIFLAGFCEGASVAINLGLSFPDKFAGVVALNGWLPDGPLPLNRQVKNSDLGVFIGHGSINRVVPMRRAKEAHRLLASAGLAVEFREYPTDHWLSPAMLRDVDRWVLDECHRRIENPRYLF